MSGSGIKWGVRGVFGGGWNQKEKREWHECLCEQWCACQLVIVRDGQNPNVTKWKIPANRELVWFMIARCPTAVMMVIKSARPKFCFLLSRPGFAGNCSHAQRLDWCTSQPFNTLPLEVASNWQPHT